MRLGELDLPSWNKILIGAGLPSARQRPVITRNRFLDFVFRIGVEF